MKKGNFMNKLRIAAILVAAAMFSAVLVLIKIQGGL
jgi:hypothetical protein